MPLVDCALEYFLAAFDAGSVNTAARRLYVANSAISRQIGKLERELGVTLFDRSPAGISPTDAGRALAAYARRTMAEAARVGDELHAHTTARANIFVAGVDGLVHSLLPRICAEFHAGYPATQIRLLRATPAQVTTMVKDGTVDVGVTFSLSLATGVAVRYTQQSPIRAFVRHGHPLAGRSMVSMRDLIAYPLALSHPTSTSRVLIDAYAATHLLPITPAFECDDPAAVVQFVASTDAVTLLHPVTLSPEDAARVSAVPLRDRELRQRALQVQCRAHEPRSTVLESFLERLVAALEETVTQTP